MPLGTAPNDIFQNGKWYNRQGVEIGSQLSLGWGIPVCLPPSGTIAANGALTLGTALPKIYSGGLWMYFPAGAVSSGSTAGMYWTVMSSTTVGTVFANFLAVGGTPSTPTTLTAVVDAGPGAYTTPTTVLTSLVVLPIPGGVLGPSGQLRMNIQASHNLAAGTKTLQFLYGGTTILTLTRTTAGGQDSFTTRVRNTAAENRNSFFALSESSSSSATAATATSIDTSVPQNLSINFTTDTATNFLTLDNLHVETFYQA